MWTGFVILAGMRTGSNALEERLALHAGVTTHGELFNPGFIGREGVTRAYGLTLAERERDPGALLEAATAGGGLHGFRLFEDHDERILARVLADPGCAKIVLTRNPLESYVSLKIALETGQWWLGDPEGWRARTVRFDAAEFACHRARQQGWHARIRRSLQAGGQTAFSIDHAELGEPGVVEGLARWLGAGPRREGAAPRGLVQNPGALADRVENPGEMRAALEAADPWGIDHVPRHEPERGASVPGWAFGPAAPLLYMPVPGAADRETRAWLRALNGGALEPRPSQRTLRDWRAAAAGYRTFTVVRHPLARAHESFCRFLLPDGPETRADLRALLRERYGVPLPGGGPAPPDGAAHRRAFLAFLAFVRANLNGQTATRADPVWASQEAILRGVARVAVPDAVLRAESLAAELAALGGRFGLSADLPAPGPAPVELRDIHDAELEAAGQAAYRRDYLAFGYGAWAAQGAGQGAAQAAREPGRAVRSV